MYRNILLPTDGSRLAAKGVRAGVQLARTLGARVTGVYVVAPHALEAYRRERRQAAMKALAAIAIEAQSAGVACQTRIVTAPKPHAGILRAARAAKCDAIAMASHGRGAIGGLVLGSETARVLSRSRLPVLVTR